LPGAAPLRLGIDNMQQSNFGVADIDQPAYGGRQHLDPRRQIDRDQHATIFRHILPLIPGLVTGNGYKFPVAPAGEAGAIHGVDLGTGN
jgi:hypothetical protein